MVRIDDWTDFVGTFDPGKVVARAKRAFPAMVLDSTDHSAAEVERIKGHVADLADPVRSTMLRQITRKAQDNGPTFRFEILADAGTVRGWARRYEVAFDLPEGINDNLRMRLVAFLQDLKLGEPRLDTDSDSSQEDHTS